MPRPRRGLTTTVSPEMVVIVGPGAIGALDLDRPPVLALTWSEPLTIAGIDGASDAAAAVRHRSGVPAAVRSCPAAPAAYHLSAELRVIAFAVRDCPTGGAAGGTLRGAKCVELLCGIFAALGAGALVRTGGRCRRSTCAASCSRSGRSTIAGARS